MIYKLFLFEASLFETARSHRPPADRLAAMSSIRAEVKSDQRRRREEARAHRRAEKHAARGARRGSRGARPADAS